MSGTTKGIDGVYPLDTDSGWVDISSGLQTGWTATTVVARRYGAVVHLIVKNLDYSSGGSTSAIQLPDGFRPDYEIEFLVDDTTPTASNGDITEAGVVEIATTVDNVEITITYMTSNAWPARN